MSGSRIFVDTNIMLYHLKGDLTVNAMLTDMELSFSFISEIELLSFPGLTGEVEMELKQFFAHLNNIDFNQEIKELTIDIRRRYRLKVPDAIIAASAFYTKLPLLTADKDFQKLEEIDVVLYDVN
jgi:predicted nucleic acid-binding protein